MSDPAACIDCLRRAWLLAALAPYIERIATGAPGSRSPELLRLSDADLAAVAAPGDAARILEEVGGYSERRLRGALESADCWACCCHDDGYPSALHDAADAPRALIGRGDFDLLAGLAADDAATIVGARRASSYGREVARELGRDLAAAGILVVSGLAFGIDAAAHRGALEAGPTLAVLGCGADLAYPAAHRSLWRRIAERGAVVSEMPPGSTPWRWTFPARNRVMAALARITVVIEAAERSGSLITAEQAADLGRDVGAVPGPVTSRVSAGPNMLLAGGACLVRDAQDVLDAMLGPGARRPPRAGPALEPLQASVLEAVEAGEGTCDTVAAALGCSGAEVAGALGALEAMGYVTCSLLGVYSRTLLAVPPDGVSI